MTIDELATAPSQPLQIDNADAVEVPPDLPYKPEVPWKGAVYATSQASHLQNRIDRGATPLDLADPEREDDHPQRDASLCESMDRSFARPSAPFRLPPRLGTRPAQSFVSQSYPSAVTAPSEPRATLPPSAECAAVLPDGSDFAGAPLRSFPATEFMTFADRLPSIHAGLPSKHVFPPLETWEDICAEMNYLCSRFGLPHVVSVN
ncbi:hypothetical protein PHLGIDRAFT_244322 [Phlebiopsis gigantea 11061_1 CR5-6]|uniref:Uncharacterized protein n=1 Tax=Phlebiopsis gigantea (strain 11061_1 CR5-6) TaxID=745531 RepID=A0A0C3NFA3_PHLG1|nr:hypothetical protein PHLGIDRAFT_244322 [Phlebiopsis gigantea 11061_1 CR5-6]